MKTPELIGGSEAARVARVNRTTIWHWTNAGLLSVTVEKGRMRYDREDVIRLAAARLDARIDALTQQRQRITLDSEGKQA